MKSIVNEGRFDRFLRIIVGLALVLAGYEVTSHTFAIILYIVGAVALLTGIIGFCLIYRLFGVNTCPVKTK
ncbi:YgaP family membrane protein [Alicyclobacillus sp. ALC3]|uniref:YgaP family membrane protein n=1 Tax=Alicyclobacillus sp. ALC3 TaxID=2796143 RepID=UPI0023792580|nr:DUF2892 domain-containing protein [Alicyclobacillus sp. ALC3]WDL99127.1 DUF2892 domain-containing protein [Alicyclobacillus sp. ALC3]